MPKYSSRRRALEGHPWFMAALSLYFCLGIAVLVGCHSHQGKADPNDPMGQISCETCGDKPISVPDDPLELFAYSMDAVRENDFCRYRACFAADQRCDAVAVAFRQERATYQMEEAILGHYGVKGLRQFRELVDPERIQFTVPEFVPIDEDWRENVLVDVSTTDRNKMYVHLDWGRIVWKLKFDKTTQKWRFEVHSGMNLDQANEYFRVEDLLAMQARGALEIEEFSKRYVADPFEPKEAAFEFIFRFYATAPFE